ncbi:YHS domain-containing (seleno)protein [Amphritea sp. HPY]|uniref:YHS domain-containing (seleno)protein n=1 Tax=Amphritea sp. HPY TaxID=3421652 RepID=UPI003D7DA2DF
MIASAKQNKTIPSIFATLLLLLSIPAVAKEPVYTSFFSDVAISGYDAVAYFTENKPQKGSSNFVSEYKGAQWHFKTAANLAAFKASPEKYAPQYGGYCAWAVANNDTASGDPQQWTIHDGKLYLNYDAKVQSMWLKDKVNLIEKADSNWPGVIR